MACMWLSQFHVTTKRGAWSHIWPSTSVSVVTYGAELTKLLVHGPGIEPPSPLPPSPPPPGDFWRQWFLNSSICVLSISACLQDELLCFCGLSEMVHISLVACVKMGVSLTNPKQQVTIPFFGHTKILHMLVLMGSTALVLSYPGMVARITRGVGVMKY